MIRQYRKQWLRWHKSYENKARIIFQKSFKEIANNISFDNITENTYKAYITFHVSQNVIFDTYKKVYLEIGSTHGKRVGVKINKQINQKDFTIDNFITEFEKNVVRFLIDEGGQRITSVRQNFISYINELISRGFAEGKSVSEIATDMQRLIKSRNFYRWQSLRIARTETTTASNYSAYNASKVSGVLMDKVWISAIDGRTRRPPESHFDHYEMNQVRVSLDEPFNVGGEELMYPGDVEGSAGNVINCRCSVAQVVRRDKEGRVIRL